jgi:hypothetical protein
MIFMLNNAIFAYKTPVITAEVIGMKIRMIFTEYLVHILGLRKNIFDLLIYFERNLPISVNIAVIIAMAVCAFKVIFLSYSLLSILRGLDHLSFYARSASIDATAKHNNRLS